MHRTAILLGAGHEKKHSERFHTICLGEIAELTMQEYTKYDT